LYQQIASKRVQMYLQFEQYVMFKQKSAH